MTPREVYVVVPLSRPHMLDNVLANYCRQRYRAQLVIVENGAAVGACARAGAVPDVLCSCARDVGLARQTGVDAVRERGGYVVFMDDDDWYGAGYVEEAVAHAARGRVTVKGSAFVQGQDGTLRLFAGLPECSPIAGPVQVSGGTFGFWASEAASFPTGLPAGEDVAWLARMRAAGAEVYATSRYHYLYVRRNLAHRHAWRTTDRQMIDRCPGPVLELGPVDLDMIEGRKPLPVGGATDRERSDG